MKVTGRPIHNRTCLVPREVYGRPGYEYVVPLVTDEAPGTGKQNGVILSKGFMQQEWANPTYRWRIENTLEQTFEGYISDLSELKGHGFLDGNATDLEKINFTHSDMKEFAEASGFENKAQASVALIERLEPGSPLDERCGTHYAHGAIYENTYPYPKTLAGALQLAKMPW